MNETPIVYDPNVESMVIDRSTGKLRVLVNRETFGRMILRLPEVGVRQPGDVVRTVAFDANGVDREWKITVGEHGAHQIEEWIRVEGNNGN